MSTVYRWIKCATPGCDSKYSGFYLPDFDFLSKLPDGWTTDPAHCPDCNATATPDAGDDRILVVPLACGAFTAYAPRAMASSDWMVIQGICGALAGIVAGDDVEIGSGLEYDGEMVVGSGEVTDHGQPCGGIP